MHMRSRDCGTISDWLWGVLISIILVYDIVLSVYFAKCFNIDWGLDNASLIKSISRYRTMNI